ncbi:MAG: hypothetical protein P1U88_11195 [Thalassobaculaceae bacterium]|nr:hypothetical protein [Thalassobaculaceae bacterium]
MHPRTCEIHRRAGKRFAATIVAGGEAAGAAQGNPAQIRAFEHCSNKLRARQIRLFQRSVPERGAAQIGSREDRARQIAADEPHALKVRASEIDLAQILAGEIGSEEIGMRERGRLSVGGTLQPKPVACQFPLNNVVRYVTLDAHPLTIAVTYLNHS